MTGFQSPRRVKIPPLPTRTSLSHRWVEVIPGQSLMLQSHTHPRSHGGAYTGAKFEAASKHPPHSRGRARVGVSWTLTAMPCWGTTKHENAASHSGLDPESKSSFRRRPDQGLDSGLRRYEYLFSYKVFGVQAAVLRVVITFGLPMLR